ncbi:hypothetical protein OS493_040506, partial [Desmophyllum pertusum]
MAERTCVDRVLLPVTAAIYRNGEEKQAMRWSFEIGIGGESDKKLFDLIFTNKRRIWNRRSLQPAENSEIHNVDQHERFSSHNELSKGQ